jgi:cellobiose phosphorylase
LGLASTFAVRRDLMDEAAYKTLLAVARVVLHTRNGTIFDQIERAEGAALQARDALRPAGAAAIAKCQHRRRRRLQPRSRAAWTAGAQPVEWLWRLRR